jgi:hypothetical protein
MTDPDTQAPAAASRAAYETVISSADTSVAQFDGPKRSPLGHVQHFLHSQPDHGAHHRAGIAGGVRGVWRGDGSFRPSTCR